MKTWQKVCLILVSILLLIAATGKPKKTTLEIFSWWAGDEGPALEALIDLYTQQNPEIEVENSTVTGGSGVNARAVLKTRMLGGDPPDSFQVHAGQELIGTYVSAERMEDLTFLFEEEGWLNVFPPDLVKLLGTGDGIWSVPVNIHRSNVMWYIPGNMEKWGIKVPTNLVELIGAAEKLRGMGIVPLALGETWTVNHLWESVALGVLGPDLYEALWTGELPFDSPEGIQVWAVMAQVLEYTNEDAASLSWQQATDMVINGTAAFNIMGDWAAGYLSTTKKLKPGKDYAWTTPPGQTGVFMFLADSFGLPRGARNTDATIAWLRLLGSREGQDTFNPLKGSISARTDTDLSRYNAYPQSAAEDLKNNRITGSMVHGVVANEKFMSDFSTIMGEFLQNRDPGQAAASSQAFAIQDKVGM